MSYFKCFVNVPKTVLLCYFIIRYIGGVIYSLMSGPTEEPVVEVKEEEKGRLRLMPALPPTDESAPADREESQP